MIDARLSNQVVRRRGEELSIVEGLEANLEKSSVGGLCEAEKARMQEILGIPIGAFPIRYLGVPLTYKKLTIQQCKPLVERVTSKMRGWATKFLSYAGRLQLIKGVRYANLLGSNLCTA